MPPPRPLAQNLPEFTTPCDPGRTSSICLSENPQGTITLRIDQLPPVATSPRSPDPIVSLHLVSLPDGTAFVTPGELAAFDYQFPLGTSTIMWRAETPVGEDICMQQLEITPVRRGRGKRGENNGRGVARSPAPVACGHRHELARQTQTAASSHKVVQRWGGPVCRTEPG
jgi:hypothetical protein